MFSSIPVAIPGGKTGFLVVLFSLFLLRVGPISLPGDSKNVSHETHPHIPFNTLVDFHTTSLSYADK
jgi:hypothetical protein